MIKIVVDCFGGDNSPEANIEGSLKALSSFNDLYLILTGDENIIRACLKDKNYPAERLSIVHAPEIITNDDKPTDAIRLKRESSMMVAIKLLRENDEISGMVSVGATGSLVAAGLLRVGRIPGVIRPAFCPILPTMNGGIVGVSDSGANVDITPDMLPQYAVMSSIYLETVYGIKNPRIALLNIGIEEEKGDLFHKEAFRLLSETPGINFVGNMESRDLLSGSYDLVVCDGFSGNVLIKASEGTALSLLKKLKSDIGSSLRSKIGALFMKKMLLAEKKFMDYQNYGGSILIGCRKTIIKGHGSSKATAVYKCIEQAYLSELGNMNKKIEEALMPKQEM